MKLVAMNASRYRATFSTPEVRLIARDMARESIVHDPTGQSALVPDPAPLREESGKTPGPS